MKNKIVVTIGGKDYTMVAAEDESMSAGCAQAGGTGTWRR